MSAIGSVGAGARSGAGVVAAWRRRLESPLAAYYLLLGATFLLVGLGLVMVLSASSVTSYEASGSSYTEFKKQAMWAVLGLIAFVIATRISIDWLRRLAMPTFVVALLLQLAVFSPLGKTVKGNRNWLALGGFTMQPSEFGKIALVLLGAVILNKKRKSIGSFAHVAIPFLFPLGLLLLGLVLLGHDLGTALVFILIIAAILFVAGVRMRWFVGAALAAAAAVIVLVKVSENRMGRIDAWLGTCVDTGTAECYQKTHALYALADGGWWGVGLGASREKWSWLPEAHNDFIFAIIGEELGLPGSLVVLGLYLAIAYAGYRVIVRTDSLFVRLVSAGIVVWIVGQALINIGSVTGLLPVIGIPLPLVSSGGSALVSTLAALGVLVSFARQDPQCKAALAQRRGTVRRTLSSLPAQVRKARS
ncbi:putative lipid II flippase FtsW [Dermacoccaceae bacterium W4C1]